jgi:hypothetical protein
MLPHLKDTSMDMKTPQAAPRLPAPELAGFLPRIVNRVLEVPVYYMRGGTSTGIVL